MKVSELIDRMREFDSDAEVYLQYDRRGFASPVWVGIMNTSGLFEEEEDLRLVISPWEPEVHRRSESEEQRAPRKVLAELVAYDQELGLTDEKKRE
jgi:hypothetical protein